VFADECSGLTWFLSLVFHRVQGSSLVLHHPITGSLVCLSYSQQNVTSST